MSLTNFCCRSGGSNLNAGTRTGDTTVPGTSAALTYASGNWVASTGVFTVASGNPSSDGVAVGDFASVYADGSTVTGFVGRVTARDATTITVSLSNKAGTAPTDGTGNRTLKIGGAWKGPNGAEAFPFGFIKASLTNVAGDRVRINMRNDADFSITATVNQNSDPIVIQGFVSSYGDGGRAAIDGGTTGASYKLFRFGSWGCTCSDMIFKNNGDSGSESAVYYDTAAITFRCVAHDIRGIGFDNAAGTGAGSGNLLIECEAYNCNQSNTSLLPGIFTDAGACVRCISHDNSAGSNCHGYGTGNSGGRFVGCIADSNGGAGFKVNPTVTGGCLITNCDAYNNTGDGFALTNGTNHNLYMENCNAVKNGGYGINLSAGGGGQRSGFVFNCGFGSGSQANTSGDINASDGCEVSGSITYASNVTPWIDPANGDFRINLAAAQGAGRGAFTETAASYAGTVGFPDIGSAQHEDSGGAQVGPFDQPWR
jgi:hypothetical protein